MKKILLAAVALCCIAMAAMMTACTTDSVDNPTPQGKTIHLKMKVSTGDDAATTRSVFHPATGMMEFSDGDEIYLASSGRYIGKLTMHNNLFEGDILEPTVGEFLYVFFLGNKNIGDLYPGDTECMVKILDQSQGLPFLGYGMSFVPYTTPDETYIIMLTHQTGIVEVVFNTGTDETVTLSGMKTTALIDFSDPENPITTRNARGTITMFSYDDKHKYALLLPQEAMTGVTMTVGSKQYTIDIPQIECGHSYIGDKAIFKESTPIRIDFSATAGTKNNDNEGYAMLLDKNPLTKWCVNKSAKKDGVWFVEFNSLQPFTPTAYTLTTGNDCEQNKNRNPKDWRLMAKAEQSDEWTVISEVSGDQTMKDKNLEPYSFALDVTDRKWQYFRFEVSANQGADNMQLTELMFHATDIEEAEEPFYFIMDGQSDGRSPVKNLFDNNLRTIWSGQGWGEFHPNKPIAPTGYYFTTRGDGSFSPNHTPRTWKLLARNHDYEDWQTISEIVDNHGMNYIHSSYYFPITEPIREWQYFRLEFIRGGEIAEFRFDYGDELHYIPINSTHVNYIMDSSRDWSISSMFNDSYSSYWRATKDDLNNGIWYGEFMTSKPINPIGYIMGTSNNANWPRSWKLMAKVHQSDAWQTIAQESENYAMSGKSGTYYFPLANSGQTWQFFRLEVSRTKDYTSLTLAKFRFYVEGEATPEPAVNPGPGDNPDPKPQAKPFEAYAGSPGITSYDGYDKAVDGNNNTSWETKLEHKSNGVWFVEFRSREPLEVKGYTIWSKDYTPWKFKLYGKLTEKEQWILLSNKEIYEDYDWYPREIPIDNIIPTFRYQYFRFEVSEQWHPEGPSYYDRIIIEELKVHE